MKKILSHLTKEREDQRNITIFLFIYTILLMILGWELLHILSIDVKKMLEVCLNGDKLEPIFFFLILLSKDKYTASLISVTCQSVALGYSARALLSTISSVAESKTLFFLAFFARNILVLSALVYLSLAIFSHSFAGKSLYGKLSFLQVFLFCVGVSFAADLLYNSMTSVLVKGCTNAIQSF